MRARASLVRQRPASLHESQGPESHAGAGARAAVMSLASCAGVCCEGNLVYPGGPAALGTTRDVLLCMLHLSVSPGGVDKEGR